MAIVLVIGAVALATAVGARLGYLAGVRRGRATLRRYVHDTVLQTLDAIGIAAPSDATDTPGRLAELRQAARTQATELRRGLADPARLVGSLPLDEELGAVAEELARDGLRTRLMISGTQPTLPARRRAALRDATREALRNTVKHSGTTEATVRVAQHAGGIMVITRDHGVGFDPSTRPGFGISECIIARMADVGGRADIRSRPGWGTWIAVWVPK